MTAAEYKARIHLSSHEEGVWRTINGAHVFIEGGKITKGPAHMTGKTVDEAAKSGNHSGVTAQDGAGRTSPQDSEAPKRPSGNEEKAKALLERIDKGEISNSKAAKQAEAEGFKSEFIKAKNEKRHGTPSQIEENRKAMSRHLDEVISRYKSEIEKNPNDKTLSAVVGGHSYFGVFGEGWLNKSEAERQEIIDKDNREIADAEEQSRIERLSPEERISEGNATKHDFGEVLRSELERLGVPFVAASGRSESLYLGDEGRKIRISAHDSNPNWDAVHGEAWVDINTGAPRYETQHDVSHLGVNELKALAARLAKKWKEGKTESPATRDKGGIALSAAEYKQRIELSRDTGGGRWITIKSHDEEGGGTHVYIEGGRITKGPAALTGKKLGELSKSHKVTAEHGSEKPKEEAKPEKANDAGDGKMVARTKPRERFDVANGTRHTEFRVRRMPESEGYERHSKGEMGSSGYKTHILESRTVRKDASKPGQDEVSQWEVAEFGNSEHEAISAYGGTEYEQADSLHPAHGKYVADTNESRRISAEHGKLLEKIASAKQSHAEYVRDAEREFGDKVLKETRGVDDPAQIQAIRDKVRAKMLKKHEGEVERLRAESMQAQSELGGKANELAKQGKQYGLDLKSVDIPAPSSPPAKAKEPHEMTREEYKNHLVATEGYRSLPRDAIEVEAQKEVHKSHIKDAIASGKSVPGNVMAEYPELRGAAPGESKAVRGTQRLLDAVKQAVATPIPGGTTQVAAEPWQMTLDDVAQKGFIGYDASGKAFVNEKGKSGLTPQLRANHREEVEKALRSGKPVPAEVLADYPDLAKPSAPTAKEYGERVKGEGIADLRRRSKELRSQADLLEYQNKYDEADELHSQREEIQKIIDKHEAESHQSLASAIAAKASKDKFAGNIQAIEHNGSWHVFNVTANRVIDSFPNQDRAEKMAREARRFTSQRAAAERDQSRPVWNTSNRAMRRTNLSASAYANRTQGERQIVHLSAAPLHPSASPAPKLPAKMNGVDLSFYWADALHAGELTHPRTGARLKFTPERLDKLAANLSQAIANGVDVPIVRDHRETADSVVGYVFDAKREGDKLMVLHGVFKDQESLALRNRISLGIDPDFRDGKGTRYGEAIRHSALTPIPVQPGQQGFRKAA